MQNILHLFFILDRMKWYPFWKTWYFTREQRVGIIVMVVLIVLIAIIKGPILEYLYRQQKDQIHTTSLQHWDRLQSQIDSSKRLQKLYRDSIKSSNPTYSKKASPFVKKTTSTPSTSWSIDINSADAEGFKKLYGIGDVLSKRIVAYRDKLGGFYSIEQLKEVYGLQDSTFQVIRKKLVLKKTTLTKININASEIETLEKHPYISGTLAKQIYNYRIKVKPFESVEEIKKMYSINDSIYNKLYPYLTIY